jgi:formylmethanofuran dehydrogenase, subunit C (EC 1.2.99.5)
METITMTLVQEPELFLECYSVTPDLFAGKSLAEIADLPAHEGKIQWKLGDFLNLKERPVKPLLIRRSW